MPTQIDQPDPDEMITLSTRVRLDRRNPIRDFHLAERDRFLPARAERIGYALGNALEHFQYCEIIASRAAELSESHRLAVLALMDLPGDRSHVSEPVWSRQRRLNILLHLEIQTYYQFAKSTLDRLARAFRVYFGPADTISVDSHKALISNLGEYAEKKGLTQPPPELLRSGGLLLEGLVLYRDKRIVHDSAQASYRGTIFDPGKGATIVHIPGKESKDTKAQSEFITDIQDKLSGFVFLLIGYMQENTGKAAGIR